MHYNALTTVQYTVYYTGCSFVQLLQYCTSAVSRDHYNASTNKRKFTPILKCVQNSILGPQTKHHQMSITQHMRIVKLYLRGTVLV